MVAKVKAALNIRFQGHTAPRNVSTERGNGFYVAGTGCITAGYLATLKTHGLRALLGEDASVQPGQLQELMLHETAVSWIRERFKKTQPKKAWEESVEEYRTRLKTCVAFINSHHDVESLCREFPDRLAELAKRQGDRLAK